MKEAHQIAVREYLIQIPCHASTSSEQCSAMSFPSVTAEKDFMRGKMGNVFPKRGNELPISADRHAAASYEVMIARAIRRELGGSRRAIKTLMRRTGASARTAKNWLSAASGPSGAHLVELMRTSDEVFETVLFMSNRNAESPAEKISEVKKILKRALALLGSEISPGV